MPQAKSVRGEVLLLPLLLLRDIPVREASPPAPEARDDPEGELGHHVEVAVLRRHRVEERPELAHDAELLDGDEAAGHLADAEERADVGVGQVAQLDEVGLGVPPFDGGERASEDAGAGDGAAAGEHGGAHALVIEGAAAAAAGRERPAAACGTRRRGDETSRSQGMPWR